MPLRRAARAAQARVGEVTVIARPNAASTGVAQIGAGKRPRRLAAACSARLRPSFAGAPGAREQPTRPSARTRSRAPPRLPFGASLPARRRSPGTVRRRPAGDRFQAALSPRGWARRNPAPCPVPGAAPRLPAVYAPVGAGRPPHTPPRSRAGRPAAARAAQMALSGPGARAGAHRHPWPTSVRGDLRGDVGAQRPGQLEQQLLIAQPRGTRARRSAAAASAEPPPSPAATGIRLRMLNRRAGPSHPVLDRNARNAAAARFLLRRAWDPWAHELVLHRTCGSELERELVGQRDRLHHRHQLVPAVLGPRGPEEQPEVHLRGGQRAVDAPSS